MAKRKMIDEAEFLSIKQLVNNFTGFGDRKRIAKLVNRSFNTIGFIAKASDYAKYREITNEYYQDHKKNHVVEKSRPSLKQEPTAEQVSDYVDILTKIYEQLKNLEDLVRIGR